MDKEEREELWRWIWGFVIVVGIIVGLTFLGISHHKKGSKGYDNEWNKQWSEYVVKKDDAWAEWHLEHIDSDIWEFKWKTAWENVNKFKFSHNYFLNWTTIKAILDD